VLDGRVLAHGPEADKVYAEAMAKSPGREPVRALISSMIEIL
jgi:hypothetical protein